jgi:glycosyltransferase involved in cell wall biosynthesis
MIISPDSSLPYGAGVLRLSVIVPFYNVQRFAAENLRSLSANADPGIEFVLVDDGSTDATWSIVTTAAERLARATLVELRQNRGLSAARNAGMRAARGRYLTFIDGDDVAVPGHFSRLVEAIEALGCDFVRTDHVQVRGRERVLHRIVHGPRGVVCPPRSGICRSGQTSSVDAPWAWAGVYSRRLLEAGLLNFDEDLRTCEDRPWIWRLHLRAESFAVVGLHGIRYRRDVSQSLTQANDERQFDFIPAFERILASVRADRDAALLLPKALRTYFAIICHHIGKQDRYPTPVRRQLRSLVGRSLARLPESEREPALADLDQERARTVRKLLAAA